MRKKTGGRKVGSVNKITKSVREKLDLMLNECMSDLRISELNNREKIELIGKLLPFLVPKLNTITIDDQNTNEDYFKPIEVRIIKPIE
jgi:hypothetical protein